MKYITFFAALLFFAAACSSPQKTEQNVRSASQQDGGIIDEEYDLLVAPQYDYDTNVSYEEQIKIKPDAKNKSAKSSGKPTSKPKAIKK
ncbi:MAG: hypothetical protein LBG46_02685 [Elusimicrobiota bacterium]|jgi:hypothetical protein|nr:hypothetical protein [Elusimicrobiota bacterium]